MTRVWLENHPMKKEAVTLLKQHFADSIVDNFMFMFEAELYDSPNVSKQVRDDKLIMEVRYKTGQDTSEYVCDIYSWMDKKEAEYKLLRYITDLFKTGKIGKDWTTYNGKLVSKEVKSGKHATKDELQKS